MRGLYIHIPFCIKKCKYCDFTSYTGREELFERYIAVLETEMKKYSGEAVDTVFIGGGTPTILSGGQLRRLLTSAAESFKIEKNAEITIEANPQTLDKNKLAVLRDCGVNRISVGVQSFNDAELAAIGRIHNAETAYNTVRLIRENGFENINIDLMLSLPLQTKKSLAKTLRTAFELEPEHISLYSLILEEGTPLLREVERGEVTIPEEDTDREAFAYAAAELAAHGYAQYEISNFARQGRECHHNIKYWSCGEYIGIGAAAHSYMGGVRFSNTASLEGYLSGNFESGERTALSERDRISEFIIMGMRMTQGISKTEFYRRFGCSVDELFGEAVKKFTDGGFLEEKGDFLCFTSRGIDVSNSILCEFV